MIAKLQAMLGMDPTNFNAKPREAGNSVNKFAQGLKANFPVRPNLLTLQMDFWHLGTMNLNLIWRL